MDWSIIGGLVGQAAPTIGSLLGGFIPFPGGAVLGEVAGKVLAEALGVAPTPAAVKDAIDTRDPVEIQARLSEAEAKMQTEVEKFKAQLADVQDARAQTLALVDKGSNLQWGPVIISVVVVLGFSGLSFLAMRPDLAGVRSDVVLYLLGAWQSLATAAVTYWIGSSSGSQDKSAQIATMASSAAASATKAAAKK